LILPGENRLKSFCFASLVIALLTLSLIVAVPVRGAVMSSSSESGVPAAPVPTQVEPTLLAGYKAVGVLSPSVPVMVTVGIPLQDEQSLEYLSQQISMPGSPLYRHFLSQAQVQTFLPTSEYQAALAYLEQRGLIIMSSSLDSVIIAEGTASQVSQTMGLSIETYSNGTSSYYSASGVSPIQGAYVDVSNVTAVLLSHPPDLATARPAPSIVSGSSQSNQTAPGESYPLTDLQSVYNATALYSRGDNGAGYTAGILDFYGDPYIAGQLQYFDQLYGVPNAPLNVIPIEAYDPGLGTAEGWAPEISLDVESAHAMAPGATIDLYIANGALPLSAAIAAIVAQDKVGDLSQSFGFPESQLSSMTASSFDLNIVLTDQFYMLGSAEGITFISSTGDVGGSGGAGGPEGSVAYPSTSPYVVAVGGTTTYLTFDGTAVSSSYETAWSNYGFVPYGVNYGGGTGGVSDLEPRPWYQASLTAPAGFAQGREVPDLSLNANVYPGIDVVVPGNLTEVSGGTSESSPLFAGLLTLLMTSAKSELGLINPGLYSLAQNPSLYPKVYHPITFGYIIPWVSQPGYNMATGWGAPNIGEMAHYSLGGVSTGGLGVNVTVTEKGVQPFEVLPGAALSISAKVTSGASTVGTGSFNAELDTLTGTLMTVPLTFSPTSGTWVGQLTSPANASGFAYVTVKGSSGGVSGTGFASIFAGYLADFITPSPDAPYDTQFGITLVANITTLDGKSVGAGTVSFSASSYSLSSNTYTKVATLSGSTLGQYDNYWSGTLLGDYAYGPMVFAGNDGVYGYLPIINGVGMQSSFIETSVLAEPGVVAPGQTLFVLATLSAPGNMPDVLSLETGLPVYYDLEVGSNVTVSLVSQSGKTVATQPIYENSFLSTVLRIQGELTVPAGTAPGLYDVILRSSFDSYTLDKSIDGYYFGQVYVGASQSSPRINISPSTLYEGQTVSVTAKIDYANGTSVKYGMYSAAVYPKDLQNAYNALTETIQVPLWFDTATGLWTGNVTLPSEYNSGGTVQIDPGALYLSGPYEIFISGLSADGIPSSTDISTQKAFTVQPYLLLSGQDLTSLPQTYQVAFANDTIAGPKTLTGDLFLGANTIEGGAFTISSSQIEGTLTLNDATATLTGVSGGSVVAENSALVVLQSNLDSLQLTDSTVTLNASTYQRITPSIPVIVVQSPAPNQNYNGTSGTVTVTGQQVANVLVYLDGEQLTVIHGSQSSYTFPLDSGTLSLGVHSLRVVATQGDGMSSTMTIDFSAEGTVGVLNSTIGLMNNTISSLSSQASSANSSEASLRGTVQTLTSWLYLLALTTVVALVVAIAALVRKGGRRAEASPAAAPAPAPTEPPEPS
jgi:subtilase family serine protease